LKRIIKITICLMLLSGFVANATEPYQPPTDDELAAWWEALPREERLAELRRIDEIDHATPDLAEPRLVVLQTENGTIHAYFDGQLGIDIAGHLQYQVTLPQVTVKGTPQQNVWCWFGTGAAAGILLAIGISLLF